MEQDVVEVIVVTMVWMLLLEGKREEKPAAQVARGAGRKGTYL